MRYFILFYCHFLFKPEFSLLRF